MKYFILLTIFISPYSFADIFQWTDKNGTIHYSDAKPSSNTAETKKIKLKEPVLIEKNSFTNYKTRIISWEVTKDNDSYINLAVKYHYDGEYKDNKIWISAHTLDHGSRSMNYSVRPTKISLGTGIANIHLGVSSRAPKRHCTNKIGLTMYGKDIPTFHKATINFSKCWTNNYIIPTESTPKEGIN